MKGETMKTQIKYLSLFVALMFCASAVSEPSALASQRRRPASVEKDLTLSIGLEQLESVPQLPEGVTFRGDFKKITSVGYSDSTKQLRFTPTKIGTATLTAHDKNGAIVAKFLINVRQSALSRVAKEISVLLQEIEGVQVKILNDKVIVDGEVLLPKDITRVNNVVGQYGEQASSIVRLSPVSQKKIAEFIERDINNPEIHVRSVNETFILEGVANDEGEKAKAEIIAKTYVPAQVSIKSAGVSPITKQPVVNLISVRPPAPDDPKKMIQLVVHYVELNKDYERGFRFQWTPSLEDKTQVNFSGGDREPSSLLGQITGTVSNLLPKLNWAKQHGHARILQSSSVIVQEKSKGQIKSVTDIPYQVVSAQGQPSTNFTKAGIETVILPSLVSANSDSIQMDISFSIRSLISYSQNGPMVSDNNIQTVVVVRSGQSAAIGGLVSNSSGTNYNKLPQNVSDNPILSLYSSKDFRRNQSQFVVFITPVIKSSASSGAEMVKKKFRLRD